MSDTDVEEFFAPGGPLAQVLTGYEHRAEQVEVAKAIHRFIPRGGKLLAEAGTGTGKTMAYLAPALASGGRVVVSTGTKTLQEQLFEKDVPLLGRAIGRPIDVTLMKGRTNYLCELRAEEHAKAPPLPGTPDFEQFALIMRWRESTMDGDRASLAGLADDAPIWRELTATSEQCRGRTCEHFERCWVTQMRRRAQTAQLVIVNHHLYFADLALRERAPDATKLLPPHDLVIFDEAHELDEVAAQHFGVQVSERRFTELAHDMGRLTIGDTGVLVRLQPVLAQLETRARHLFDALPFEDGRARLEGGRLSPSARDRHRVVDELLENIEAELGSVTHEDAPALARRASELATELSFLLGEPARAGAVQATRVEYDEETPSPEPAWVRYTEVSGRTRALVARPVDVAPLLERSLGPMSCVFISATLRAGGTFAHTRARLGLADAEEIHVGSPFDYERNAALYLPDDLPEPDAPDFTREAVERTARLVAASGGGAFVLCTSHRMLAQMRARLQRERGLFVLTQGEQPKNQLVQTFRAHGDAVLVGTMSFWSGVDVAGSSLRLVVIDKLPFASPTDPVTAARMEHMKRQGQDPFRGYQLPQAALMLRQGFGRLIRRSDDRGLVAILDRRVTQRSYGAMFLKSLPECPRLTRLEEAVEFAEGLRRAA